jgi:hypothetical protein
MSKYELNITKTIKYMSSRSRNVIFFGKNKKWGNANVAQELRGEGGYWGIGGVG